SLAIGELAPKDWAKVMGKEVVSGLGVGLALAVICMLAVLLWNLTPQVEAPNVWMVGATVAIAVVLIVVWAVIIGSMFPLILERMRLDPATISSPLVATMMDISGLVIYLAVAVVMMRAGLL
ncbi:MAG: magnesium transporter, partial [Planctomycetota bacterium]